MKKGKILKVKTGYNPNSSSIGTLLIAFPCALFASAVLFNAAAAIFLSGKLSTVDTEKTETGKKKPGEETQWKAFLSTC